MDDNITSIQTKAPVILAEQFFQDKELKEKTLEQL